MLIAPHVGDIVYLLHIIPKRNPFGSTFFSIGQPGSPKLPEEKLEMDNAKGWIEDRFVPLIDEYEVSTLPHHNTQ